MLSSAGSNYIRMFPLLKKGPPSPAMEEGLVKLGQAMGDKEPPLESESQPDLPTAGYTYLGQFIDHDLTLDLTFPAGWSVGVSKGVSGKARPLRQHFRPVKLAAWSAQFIANVCR